MYMYMYTINAPIHVEGTHLFLAGAFLGRQWWGQLLHARDVEGLVEGVIKVVVLDQLLVHHHCKHSSSSL